MKKSIIAALSVSFLLLSGIPLQATDKPAAPAAAAAAPADAAKSAMPDRIVRPMRAINPITLRAEGVLIRLWGIKPAQTNETPLELRALDLMDSLIQEQQVNCKLVSGTMPEFVARCVTQGNQDLALSLLASGYAVVDRQQTYDSVFATAYEKAQESARLNNQGVWSLMNNTEQKKSTVPKWLEPFLSVLVPIALIVGPFGGLLIVAFVMRTWLKNMAEAQASEVLRTRQKEETLQYRERQVLATTLESELIENKNKIEAFLAIYGDMLRSLKDTRETPKYQQVGDIVQKHPNFSKTVFETNVNKLSLLDMKLAGHLSKLYSAMPKEAEYINLEQNVPIDTAVKLVEKIMHDAEAYLPMIEKAVSELQAAVSQKVR